MSNPFGFNYGRYLLEIIGSFWSLIYKDRDVIEKFVCGDALVLEQNYFNLLEKFLSISLTDIPLYHAERWKLLIFRESATNNSIATILKYDGSPAFNDQPAQYGPQPIGTAYKDGAIFQYDRYAEGDYFTYPLPSDLIDIDAYITNRIFDPSLIWSKGTDFSISRGVITFTHNLFNNDLIPKRNIINDEGEVVDREAALWAYNSKYDKDDLWNHFGYLVDIKMESSENYRDLIRAIFGLYTLGSKLNTLLGMLTALFGLPIIKENEETIIKIKEDSIVTNHHTYYLDNSVEKNPQVKIGATLPLFTPLSNTVKLLDNVLYPKWWRNKSFISLPVQILSGKYSQSLVLYNKSIGYDITWGNTFNFDNLGEIPILWNMGFNWGDSSNTLNMIDFIFENIIKSNIFLLTINSSDIVNKIDFNIINEALPANIYMIVEFNINHTDNYTTDRIVDIPFEYNKGKYLSDTYQNTRINDGHMGLIDFGSGVVYGGFIWGKEEFQPYLKILKRYYSCHV